MRAISTSESERSKLYYTDNSVICKDTDVFFEKRKYSSPYNNLFTVCFIATR